MRALLCSGLLALVLATTASCGKTVIGSYGGTSAKKYAGASQVQGRSAVTGAAYTRPGQAAQVSRDARAAGTRNHTAKISGDAICRTLRSQIGVPYKYGGYSPRTGFDCSGLVLWAYQQYGIKIPRTAKEQSRYGRSVPKNQLAAGDLLVFYIRGNYHTGVYLGNNSFVHSPKPGSRVKVERLNSRYWNKVYSGARRFI
jgi:cell wall-associated NlpC family hydrolase